MRSEPLIAAARGASTAVASMPGSSVPTVASTTLVSPSDGST